MFRAGLASPDGAWAKVAGLGGAIALAAAMTGASAQAEPIRGAGSTLAAPIIAKWATAYKNARADGGDFFTLDWTVDYEPVGSLAGLMRLNQPELDFAATEVPVGARRTRQERPETISDRDGRHCGGHQSSTACRRVDCACPAPCSPTSSLERSSRWSDPAIKELNPDVALPDLAINVVHRQDGSGSTYVFTQFLSSASEEWKTKLGADTLIEWPLGAGVEGTQALLRAAAATKGTISYAEYGQVSRAGLPFAVVQNKSGNFVGPDQEGVQAAANAIDWAGTTDFYASLTDRDGDAAYPISTAVFAVVQVDWPFGRSLSPRP